MRKNKQEKFFLHETPGLSFKVLWLKQPFSGWTIETVYEYSEKQFEFFCLKILYIWGGVRLRSREGPGPKNMYILGCSDVLTNYKNVDKNSFWVFFTVPKNHPKNGPKFKIADFYKNGT